MRQIVFNFFLGLHVIGGAAGLLSGIVVMIRRKGDKLHKRIGNIFAGGMITAGISSFVLSLIHPNLFLFVVGIFTMYMVITGKRYLKLKKLLKGKKPKPVDYAVSGAMFLAAILFMVLGLKLLLKSNFFGLVLVLFGGLALLMVKDDYINYKGKAEDENYWLLAHLQRFTGAFIASATAFFVVNFKYLNIDIPHFLAWMLPTLILTPLIIYWTRKNKKPVADNRL